MVLEMQPVPYGYYQDLNQGTKMLAGGTVLTVASQNLAREQKMRFDGRNR